MSGVLHGKGGYFWYSILYTVLWPLIFLCFIFLGQLFGDSHVPQLGDFNTWIAYAFYSALASLALFLLLFFTILTRRRNIL